MVKAQYHRPFRFRQNQTTVEVGLHLNQILADASGEYFCLLCDDDEFSSNFVSELARKLDGNPRASLAYSSLVIIDKDGVVLRRSKDNLPEKLTGPEFIRAIWERYNSPMKTSRISLPAPRFGNGLAVTPISPGAITRTTPRLFASVSGTRWSSPRSVRIASAFTKMGTAGKRGSKS